MTNIFKYLGSRYRRSQVNPAICVQGPFLEEQGRAAATMPTVGALSEQADERNLCLASQPRRQQLRAARQRSVSSFACSSCCCRKIASRARSRRSRSAWASCETENPARRSCLSEVSAATAGCRGGYSAQDPWLSNRGTDRRVIVLRGEFNHFRLGPEQRFRFFTYSIDLRVGVS
jgi:hypothetical protein